MDEKRVSELIEQINRQMDMITSDTTVPKNVRTAVSEAREKLNAQGEYIIRIAGAIYCIDNVSNDINLPPQARTTIWSILGMLESVKDA